MNLQRLRGVSSERLPNFLSMIEDAFKTSNGVRSKHHVVSQLAIEASSYAWSNRKTINGEPKKEEFKF